MRYFICNFDKKTRLMGSSGYFILQIRSDKGWIDKFFWYSIGDVVRGYFKYVINNQLKMQNEKTLKALLEAVQSIEKKIDESVNKLFDAFVSDDVERGLKNEPKSDSR